MLLHIANVLTPSEIAICQERLATASWGDGRSTSGPQAARVKHNLQLTETDEPAIELGGLVLRALERNARFMSAALPALVYPPMFNKYEPDHHFGAHVDNAIRLIPGTRRRIRTDLSATLFLAAPNDYDGGELVLSDTYGTHTAKLPAGDLVLYPTTSLHRVLPVTRGSRLASFFWVQSLVRDDSERTLLFELDRAIVDLSDREAEPAASLTAIYHNLVRKWSVPA